MIRITHFFENIFLMVVCKKSGQSDIGKSFFRIRKMSQISQRWFEPLIFQKYVFMFSSKKST